MKLHGAVSQLFCSSVSRSRTIPEEVTGDLYYFLHTSSQIRWSGTRKDSYEPSVIMWELLSFQQLSGMLPSKFFMQRNHLCLPIPGMRFYRLPHLSRHTPFQLHVAHHQLKRWVARKEDQFLSLITTRLMVRVLISTCLPSELMRLPDTMHGVWWPT